MKLKNRLTIIQSSTILLVLATLGYFNTILRQKEMLTDFLEKIDFKITQVAQSITTPLYSYDLDFAISIMELELNDKEVAAVAYQDPNGEISGRRLKNAEIESFSDKPTLDFLLSSSFDSRQSDMTKEGQDLGVLYLFFTNRVMVEKSQAMIIQIIIQTFITVGILIVLTLVIVNRLISPFRIINAAIENISRGDIRTNPELLSLKERQDEFGILAVCSDTMLKSIQDVVSNVRKSAEHINANSKNLSTAPGLLSKRSEIFTGWKKNFGRKNWPFAGSPDGENRKI